MKIHGFSTMVLTFLAAFVNHNSFSQLSINEFMAANSSAVTDPDYGNTADWVELYNSSAVNVDLSGYFLTDNLSDSTKYQIPAGTIINAGQFLIFWCDGDSAGVHTNFSLSSLGEEIGLYGPDQVLVDGLVYATQETDISYGRSTDGATSWAWFSPATPGASNNTSNPYDGITYYQPFFSQTGGFFSDPLSVSLTTLGGEIHYTLDGRAPSLADPVYTSAIAFDTTAFIRARVFEENKIPGPVITHSYFYDDSFAERGLGVVSLVTDPYYFWDPDSGLYVQDFKPEWEWPLNIEFFENDGNNQSVFNLPAGVKINGLWSWQLPQKMLGIYFRNEYGASSLEYPLFADRDRDQFSEFILRAGGSDWSFTLVRDGLCQELIQENAYVHHQGYRHCVVFINGEYMGIHSMRSRTDGEDLEQTFGVAEGDYDIINNHGEIEEGTDTEFWEMDALFNADLSVQANFDSLAAVVDMTDFTDYWATEIWTSNSSWGHNVKLWKPHATGKWKYIFGDLDRGFTGATDNGINEFSIPQGGSDYDYGRTWLQHTFENDGFVSYFSRRFADHLYTSFHPEYVNRMVDMFTGELVPEIPYHVDRWSGTTSAYGDGIPTVTFWEEEVAALRTFAADRQGYMLADLQQKFGLGNIVALATSSLPAEGGNIHINEFLIPGAPWNGSYFTDMPFSLTASANPGYLFQGWSTFENTLLFDFGADWKFLDNGSNQGTDWTAIDFDDAGWSTGTADFGYGDGDETTVVSYGPNSNNKYITTYFRKEFSYTGEEGTPVSALLNVVRDDGVLVYINGAEVARSNMPAGTVNYQTLATDAIGGAGETAVNAITFDVPLVNGTNTIAVEVHQSAANSSDLSFDASLSINVPAEEIISTSPTLDLALTDNAGYIARYIPTGECLLPDTIAENTTLTIDCSPYLASGDTYVLPGISLSVDPGVEIWFPEESRLVVQGDLQVNGTENAMVLFRENAAFGASSWGNVTIENATAPCHLNYLQLQNATTGTHPIHNRAAISGWYSDIVIDHCVLTENLDNPIFGEYANFTLTNSVVHSPVTGDLINVKYGDAYISDCVFIGNDQVDTDAIDYDRVGNGVIRNSVVHSFFGPNSDAIDLGEECTDVLIENCLLHNCTDKGISCGQSSTGNVQHCTIVNCNLGLGVKDLGMLDADHLTFYSNAYGIACYEKNPGLGGGFVTIANSIISNSSALAADHDDLSWIAASDCFFDTDTLEGINCNWMNPEFVNPGNYDFHLLEGSPAIGAANDFLDLGTLDHSFTGTPEVMLTELQYWHPDSVDMEYVKLANTGVDPVDLSGYAFSDAFSFTFPTGSIIAPGEEVMVAKDITLMPEWGGQIFQWESGQLNNSGDHIVLAEAHGIVIDHVQYLDDQAWPTPLWSDPKLSLISYALDNHFATSWDAVDSTIIDITVITPIVHMYPNPAHEFVIIQSDEEISEVEVFDSAGRWVLSEKGAGLRKSIQTGSLDPGLYMIRVNRKYACSIVIE